MKEQELKPGPFGPFKCNTCKDTGQVGNALRRACPDCTVEDMYRDNQAGDQLQHCISDKEYHRMNKPPAPPASEKEVQYLSNDKTIYEMQEEEIQKLKSIIDKQAGQLALARSVWFRWQQIAQDRQGQCVLPKLCMVGGDHKWTSVCEKCGMKIYYNPEATIGSEGEEPVREYPT